LEAEFAIFGKGNDRTSAVLKVFCNRVGIDSTSNGDAQNLEVHE
jgi:hypothetical protein